MTLFTNNQQTAQNPISNNTAFVENNNKTKVNITVHLKTNNLK
jgi:hypothetical protein